MWSPYYPSYYKTFLIAIFSQCRTILYRLYKTHTHVETSARQRAHTLNKLFQKRYGSSNIRTTPEK